MNNNNEEEFILTFDDDVVDLTDTTRSTISSNSNKQVDNDPYGVYNPNNQISNDPYGVYNPNKQAANDPYGVYNPNQNGAGSETYVPPKDVKGEKITWRLVLITMVVSLIYMIYFSTIDSPNFNSFLIASPIVSVLITVSFISDSILIKANYGSIYQIVLAFLLPGFYPIAAFSARGLKKTIAVLWVVLYFILSILAVKNLIPTFTEQIDPSLKVERTSADTYDSKYNEPMKKFKSLKATSNSKINVYTVIESYYHNYDWDIEMNLDCSYNITVNGTMSLSDDGVSERTSNVKMVFKLNGSMDSFTVQDLIVDGESYSSRAERFWRGLV